MRTDQEERGRARRDAYEHLQTGWYSTEELVAEANRMASDARSSVHPEYLRVYTLAVQGRSA